MASPRTNKKRKSRARDPYRMMRRAPSIEFDEEQARSLIAEVFDRNGGLPALETRLSSGTGSLTVMFGVLRAQRQTAARQTPQLLPPYGWRQLALIPPADFALTQVGAGWLESQLSADDDAWATALREGVDQFAEILWMLRGGLTVGAAVSARYFLERWTFNIASSHELEPKRRDESDAEYISRVWSVYSIPDSRNQGEDWSWLSELLHGREVAVGKFRTNLSIGGSSDFRLHSEIVRIIEYPLLQVRAAIRTLANARGISSLDHLLLLRSESLRLPKFDEPNELATFLGPADFMNSRSEPGLRTIGLAKQYREHMRHQSIDDAYKNGLSPSEGLTALIERVGRRFENAELAFIAESEYVGDRFEFGHLAARLFRYSAIAYMAEVVSNNKDEPGNDALRLAGRALNSAWEIWLEDSDLSLPTIRIIVEQTAIARVHRLKPQTATKLARAGASNGPSRWLEDAGWGRLSAYVRALGEFSHVTHRTRTRGARPVLTELQNEDDPFEADHGARREALNEAGYMLAHELAERLDRRYPTVAAQFRDGVTLLDANEHSLDLEEWLTRAMGHRLAEFGEPDADSWPD